MFSFFSQKVHIILEALKLLKILLKVTKYIDL